MCSSFDHHPKKATLQDFKIVLLKVIEQGNPHIMTIKENMKHVP